MVGGMRVWETREGVCEGGGKDGQERGSGRKVGMVLRSIAEGGACANWVEGGVQGKSQSRKRPWEGMRHHWAWEGQFLLPGLSCS